MLDDSASKPVRWGPHALDHIKERKVSPHEVNRTVTHPNAVIPGNMPLRFVYMRRYHDVDKDRQRLCCVVVEETPSERIIVTFYATSRIDRYLRGLP